MDLYVLEFDGAGSLQSLLWFIIIMKPIFFLTCILANSGSLFLRPFPTAQICIIKFPKMCSKIISFANLSLGKYVMESVFYACYIVREYATERICNYLQSVFFFKLHAFMFCSEKNAMQH